MDVRWVHPFTCLVCGPTSAGKSRFVKDLLSHKDEMITPPPHEIVWSYGQWQEDLKTLDARLVDGLPDVETWDPSVRRLLVLDDHMNETDDRITKIFTQQSHHKNVSVIFITQNLFHKRARTIHLNAHYLVLFKNPRDATQIAVLARQMSPGNHKYVLDAYKDATQRPHGYLLVDLKQATPDLYRLRARIFPSERQEVYIPK